MATTTIRAEHVGCMLRPAELLTARAEVRRGTMPPERLGELEDAAAAAALRLQQDAGMQVFTDGEMRRDDFMASVVETVGGPVPAEESSARPRWHRDADDAELEGEVAPVTIGGPLYRRTPLSLTEAKWLAGHSPGPYKITMVSPTMVVGCWRPEVSRAVHPTREDAVAALAGIYRQDIADLIGSGVTWLQLDSLAYWANIGPEAARMRRVKDLDGHLSHVIDTDNSLIRTARSHQTRVTVASTSAAGTCAAPGPPRGVTSPSPNASSARWRSTAFCSSTTPSAPVVSSRCGSFPPPRPWCRGWCRPRCRSWSRSTHCAAVSTKASRYIPLEQLALSPQCGFASTSQGNLLTADDQRRKLELVAETARLVWG